MKILARVGAGAAIAFCFFIVGCGGVGIATAGVPAISQVIPTSISAGSGDTTVQVVGSYLSDSTVLLWNDTPLSTTLVNDSTVSSPVEAASVAAPSTVELQLMNRVTGRKGNKVTFPITSRTAPLSISTTSLPGGTVGTAYSTTLSANGGTSPFSWQFTSGGMVPGLVVNSNGSITGTPTAAGTFSLGLTVTDSSQPAQTRFIALLLNIAAQPANASASMQALSVTTSSLASGTAGTAYSQALQATGGSGSYSWSIASGTLPSGLILSDSGIISGTPNASGSATFTAIVRDRSNPQQTATTVSLTISIAPVPLNISSTSVATGTSGRPYNAALQAVGGTPGYKWAVRSGALPNGLSLNSTTGVISGTPMASGKVSFVAAVNDSSSPTESASAQMTINIAAAPLSILTSVLPTVTAGTGYSQTLQATGGTAPYQWSITAGQLPAGLVLSASTGTISGTPTASGTSTFTATATDSSSPALTSSVQMSLQISATVAPMSIIAPSSATGTVGTAFSQPLIVSGGTGPYTWSVTGNLPAGVTLASNGVISGTPGTGSNGSYNVTVKVADAESPVQSTSSSMLITINAAANPLAIATSTLSSATAGTAYSQSLLATGGTTGYTWSVTAGSLPEGLTLSSGGAITGTPSASGTSSFTATVSDSSSPAQTQSANLSIVVAAAQASTGGTTWYVRPDGGTRYSANVTTGQCDGLGDAPYPGTGVNQHCAFSSPMMFFTDGSYNTGSGLGWSWIGQGGDTYLIRGSLASGASYRMGYANNGQYCDSTGCWGIAGAPIDSYMPPPPNGTASQHTRILGENYGACTSATAKTQLHGGWGLYTVMNMRGASYVDLACLDVTDFSSCGGANQAVSCDSTQDYARFGILTTNGTHDFTMTDVNIHGLAYTGLQGPTGGNVVYNRINIMGNGGSGFNADDGSGTTGFGSLLVENYNISWNGCAEEYPIVDAIPYGDCRDDQTGGYGDGFGTTTVASPAPGWQVHFDQGIVSYNTQDGLDALHISGPGSTMTVTRTLAYGNEGQQIKVGGATAIIQNSVIVGNCKALTQTIPGRPVPTGDNLGDFCRAGNSAVVIGVTPGQPAIFQNNTIQTSGNIGLEVVTNGPSVATNTLLYNNNIFIGYNNPDNDNQNPTPIYGDTDLTMLTNPGASWTNNSYYGWRANWSCPAAGESNAQCGDPGLTDETWHLYGYGNLAPLSLSSPVVGAGIVVPSISLDYTGSTRPNPPSIGAYEYPN